MSFLHPTSSVSASKKCINTTPSAAEKNKQWQREMLMEKIRSRASQQKTYGELSKAMRMSMLEKRYALDAVEKANLQKCLDSMQHCIKVTSRQGLVERLESLSRQLGLKFMEDVSSLFISSDMFYLEIILNANGKPIDVKVYHECKIEQQSCSELVDCLNRGDFSDFTLQLEGLSSIYQLNAEPKVKSKAFVALQAMENDLFNLFQMQPFSKDIQQILEKSTVGFVQKRRGGHPMKLTYFVSPYDRISLQSQIMEPLTIELIAAKQLGFHVTVHLEASSANKLQISPVVSSSKDVQTGTDVPVYAPLTSANSMLLPATFMMHLNKPLPVCYTSLRALGLATFSSNNLGSSSNIESQNKPSGTSTIMNLIVQTASEHELKNSKKGLFVCLPDQTHCYFFTENKHLKANLVTSIPFTEPSQVPKILNFIKKQALFYTLLSSCVRAQSKMGNDMDSTIILEVNANSFKKISVSLQHPYEESMVTVEIDICDYNISCTIYSSNHNYENLSDKLTNVVRTSLSIPMTIRAMLRFWDKEHIIMFQRSISGGSGTAHGNLSNTAGGFGNFSLVMGPNDSGGRINNSSTSSGIVKMESGSSRQQNECVMSNYGPTTGYIQYKSDSKTDFSDSPKSLALRSGMQSVEASSLGYLQQAPQHEQRFSKLSENEIADRYKNLWKEKTSNIKNCVSITPISTENKTSKQSIDLKRSGGIEIIPLTGQSSNTVTPTIATSNALATASSTITITPIHTTSTSALKDKKSLTTTIGLTTTNPALNTSLYGVNQKRSTEPISELQKEKKRKKKRDDSPMGPPEKIFSRQNSPAANDPAGTAATRKFSSPSSSPKASSGGLLSSGAGNSISSRPSPKHSPVYSSPKHNTASNSPKSPFGIHSPKHGSSGKPSMSTLKSATATNLSPKGDKTSGNLVSGGISSVTNRPLPSSSSQHSNPNLSTTAPSTPINTIKIRDKEKSNSLLPTANSALPANIKSNIGATSMQQLKSVANFNILASSTSLSAIELNSADLRKNVSSAVS